MYYEINVSLNGQHFFATHERSVQSLHKLRNVMREMVQRFPESEGFKVSVSEWRSSGRELTMAEVYKGEVLA